MTHKKAKAAKTHEPDHENCSGLEPYHLLMRVQVIVEGQQAPPQREKKPHTEMCCTGLRELERALIALSR